MATIRRFSAQLLAKVEKTWLPQDFKAQFVNGFWRSSKLSLRQQADLRKACLYRGVDAQSIGMPPVVSAKPLRLRRHKGRKADLTKPQRQAKIQAALDDMPQTIANWKMAKKAEKVKAKPDLPY
ncbi:hypothetical protein H4R33_006285 [Dimargaris cristalligena]|uniref:Large ribosomal subunit protein mL59 domain-containing protein n=1 Tax=Dimargaris cristalligena TaxID=215637 RepID=A0A4P9ZL08_9FUNG|nr:hypothetical protein H4R33_006285 [Dimargaris cristalligena]RKP33947.1 hypothetical protein BJ085DRAFT_36593 [Dimargaris cristalligena]|eukprot:RKP33947.1 hypothetical protein BJ085DRAFT_36593 [Dimargaris cristalligena]